MAGLLPRIEGGTGGGQLSALQGIEQALAVAPLGSASRALTRRRGKRGSGVVATAARRLAGDPPLLPVGGVGGPAGPPATAGGLRLAGGHATQRQRLLLARAEPRKDLDRRMRLQRRQRQQQPGGGLSQSEVGGRIAAK